MAEAQEQHPGTLKGPGGGPPGGTPPGSQAPPEAQGGEEATAPDHHLGNPQGPGETIQYSQVCSTCCTSSAQYMYCMPRCAGEFTSENDQQPLLMAASRKTHGTMAAGPATALPVHRDTTTATAFGHHDPNCPGPTAHPTTRTAIPPCPQLRSAKGTSLARIDSPALHA